jgi:hypothetical protein
MTIENKQFPTNRPIKPHEVVAAKKTVFPEEVFRAFNELIVENSIDGYASFEVEQVAKRIASYLNIGVPMVYTKGYLDVEDVYEAEGWNVDHDKPGYNESYKATFTFSQKKRKS